MGAHEAVPTSTQSAFPGRAAIRTAVQVGIPAFVGLLVILPPVIQTVLDGFGRHLPPELYGLLVTAAIVITSASATIARVAAIPGVIDWTRRYLSWLAPDDKKPSA
jgi:hypothetical protein